MEEQKQSIETESKLLPMCFFHNVLFGQFEFLATERAETYLKIYVLISNLPYICPSSFNCEEIIEKSIFVNFKL